jgi:hypothetical protein
VEAQQAAVGALLPHQQLLAMELQDNRWAGNNAQHCLYARKVLMMAMMAMHSIQQGFLFGNQ